MLFRCHPAKSRLNPSSQRQNCCKKTKYNSLIRLYYNRYEFSLSNHKAQSAYNAASLPATTSPEVWRIYPKRALVKMVPGSWRDLVKIPPRFPPGSRRDFGRRDSRFPPGFLPGFLAGRRDSRRPKSRRDPGGNLAGILGGRRDSRRPKSRQDPGGNLAGILGGKRDPGGQNLGRIPAGVLPGFLAGNRISRWECCRDLRRETKFLAVKIFPAAKISGSPVWNLARIRDENHN